MAASNQTGRRQVSRRCSVVGLELRFACEFYSVLEYVLSSSHYKTTSGAAPFYSGVLVNCFTRDQSWLRIHRPLQ